MLDALQLAAAELGWSLTIPPDTVELVAWLAAQHPKLIVIDANMTAEWCVSAIVAIRTSPATRKRKLIAIGMDATLLERARAAGCDASILVDQHTNYRDIILHHAPPDDRAELLRQSALPLPDLAMRGFEEFNAGRYFEQHESFEHCWRAEPGPVRALYQAILQVGVAYHQIVQGNYNGARKMFLRAQQYLDSLPDVCQTIDVAKLRADGAAAFVELERVGALNMADYDQRMLKPLQHAN